MPHAWKLRGFAFYYDEVNASVIAVCKWCGRDWVSEAYAFPFRSLAQHRNGCEK